jgi:hypothetical protein
MRQAGAGTQALPAPRARVGQSAGRAAWLGLELLEARVLALAEQPRRELEVRRRPEPAVP